MNRLFDKNEANFVQNKREEWSKFSKDEAYQKLAMELEAFTTLKDHR